MKRELPAGKHAHEVVGLYGDPSNSWGICAEFGFIDRLAVSSLEENVATLCQEFPHLGRPPLVDVVSDEDWGRSRARTAARQYGSSDPLLRVHVERSGRRVLIGAHHGVVDGLGLVGIAAGVTGRHFETLARGIGGRRSSIGFLRSSLRRLLEAAFRPPARFIVSRGRQESESMGGEDLTMTTTPVQTHGTAALAHAVLRAFERISFDSSRRAPLLVIGASRRRRGAPGPDRKTAFLRVRLHRGWDEDRIRLALSSVPPEPDFPETSMGGLGPRVTRLVRGRLGATALLSNLGRIHAPGLEYVAMFPAASGPRAVAVGLASTDSVTTLTLHTRRNDFTAEEHEKLRVAIALELGVSE